MGLSKDNVVIFAARNLKPLLHNVFKAGLLRLDALCKSYKGEMVGVNVVLPELSAEVCIKIVRRFRDSDQKHTGISSMIRLPEITCHVNT